MSSETRESLKVLQECADIQKRKSEDYQASVSDVTQADYYLYGVDSIYDMMHTKMLRIQSVLDKMRAGHDANFESVEDSAKDLINYSSFLVSFLRRKIPGQDNSKDLFGNKIVDNGAQEPGPSAVFLAEQIPQVTISEFAKELMTKTSSVGDSSPLRGIVPRYDNLSDHNLFTKDP
jgi:hypothetical protein